MIVICANDFPVAVMPAGATHEQAIAKCIELRKNDPANIEHFKRYPNISSARVHYHWHDVPEIEAFREANW